MMARGGCHRWLWVFKKKKEEKKIQFIPSSLNHWPLEKCLTIHSILFILSVINDTWTGWLWWHHWFGLFMITKATAHKLIIQPESCGILLGQNSRTIPEHKGQNTGLNWCYMNPPLWWHYENQAELNSLSKAEDWRKNI